MQCVSPIRITPKGVQTWVPCGKCVFCLQRKRNDWTFRIKNEQSHSSSAYFLTLTYADENLVSEVTTTHLQAFFKRLRKKNDKCISEIEKVQNIASKWPKIKYYAVGEYGTKTHRPHYHAIVFNIHPYIINDIVSIWGLGHVVCVPSTPATIHYTTKYVINKNKESFSLSSKNLGANYAINKKLHRLNKREYVLNDGYPMAMPRYYREKFFTPLERRAMAIKQQSKRDAQESQMLQSLAHFSAHPEMYHAERIQAEIDKKVNQMNKKNTF